MSAPLVTLTTDFGNGSPYVAAMKGALLTVNPVVKFTDLSHSLPPQDLRACSFFLRSCIPFFPADTIHVIVVDPGVGTDRALLCVRAGEQRLLVPDNGCWTEVARALGGTTEVIKLTERRFWRPMVSSTFHGRDILAPVAGHLSLGIKPQELGLPVSSWKEYMLPVPRVAPDSLDGEVIFVDDFGNLLTNLRDEEYLKCRERITQVNVAGHVIRRQVRYYGEAAIGELVVLLSSNGVVEIAEVLGNASRRLGATAGTPVHVQLQLPR